MFEMLKMKISEWFEENENLQCVLLLKEGGKTQNTFIKPTVLFELELIRAFGCMFRKCEMKLRFSIFVPVRFKKISCNEVALLIAEELLNFGISEVLFSEVKYDASTNCCLKTIVCDVSYNCGQNEFESLTIVLIKDGSEIGRATGCKIKAQKKVFELERFGAISESEQVNEKPKFYLELNDVVLGERKFKVFDLDSFDVMLKNVSFCDVFCDCSWVDFEGDYINGSGNLSKMTVISRKRRKVCAKENG
ncbi:MAG: hypothetical protein LBJ83_01020 [Oscillospiraceae bacterium]|jgi:hypothetical protein|nr:hypothetical protein [Oscillospiraceae bacterium]